MLEPFLIRFCHPAFNTCRDSHADWNTSVYFLVAFITNTVNKMLLFSKQNNKSSAKTKRQYKEKLTLKVTPRTARKQKVPLSIKLNNTGSPKECTYLWKHFSLRCYPYKNSIRICSLFFVLLYYLKTKQNKKLLWKLSIPDNLPMNFK